MTITEAGRQWGVSRATIYAKIKAWELRKNEQGGIDPNEMIRIFWHAKQKNTPSKIRHNTPENALLEQALKYEKERNEDLQKRLQAQEQQIFELLATIKDLSQGIKRLEAPQSEPTPRKKFLGIF